MRTAMTALFLFIGAGLLVLIFAILLRTVMCASKQVRPAPSLDTALDTKVLSRHLLQAIRMQTISHPDRAQYQGEDFPLLHEILETNFPLVHASLEKEVVAGYSLLYTWKGRDDTLKPILLVAHMDVVPAELFTENGAAHPAFDGRIAEGYIWGKGTLDDKYAVLGILEAVEKLLQEGFTPLRTIYLAFGHDEETGGQGGAFHIEAVLHTKGGELEFVLDEGPPIIENMLPGLLKPVALVGIAEKGSLYLDLSVEISVGNPIVPPEKTSIGILGEAVEKLECNCFPARLERPVRQMFETLAPEMSFIQKMLFANLWIFKRLVRKKLARSPVTNALIRTTAIATIFKAGVSKNLLPQKATAVLNLRLLPGDSIGEMIRQVKSIINDPRIKVRQLDEFIMKNTFTSDTNSKGFKTIEQTIRQVFPEALVAPGLCLSTTDSRYYTDLTCDIFRFRPIRLWPDNLQRYLHGSNEKISIEDYIRVVVFYIQLIRNSDMM
jgi:carboxypeptidase PM20D1